MLWTPDSKNWLIGKDPDAGKDWGQEEKGTTEDGGLSKLQEMVKDREAWCVGVYAVIESDMEIVGHDWAAEQQQ